MINREGSKGRASLSMPRESSSGTQTRRMPAEWTEPGLCQASRLLPEWTAGLCHASRLLPEWTFSGLCRALAEEVTASALSSRIWYFDFHPTFLSTFSTITAHFVLHNATRMSRLLPPRLIAIVSWCHPPAERHCGLPPSKNGVGYIVTDKRALGNAGQASRRGSREGKR